jgi:hypothetical protein
MVELDDTTFFIGMILLLTNDEEGREEMISRVCERGLEREKAEIFLDTLHKMYRKDPLDYSEPDPELVMAFARRISEISGKPVEQVLAESEALGRQGRRLH